MIRFIAVEKTAAQDIISNRILQATEFESGQALSDVLQDPAIDLGQNNLVRLLRSPEGIFFVSTAGTSSDFVVFDLDTCGLFCKRQSNEEALLIFQKVLRFAVKVWDGMRLSITERPLQNSSKVVIFPYPISLHTSFRITVETAPDKARQERRTGSGRCFLVYRSGTNDGLGPNEEASATNFRKFLDARKGLQFHSKQSLQSTPQISALSVTALNECPQNKLQPYLGYEAWLPLLTTKQLSFVRSGLAAHIESKVRRVLERPFRLS